MSPKNIILTALSICTLYSCQNSKTSSQMLEMISSSIINGEKVEESYEAVVSLVYQGNVLCTGSLVSNNTVITAAHCILPVEVPGQFSDFFEQTKVYFGNGEDNTSLVGQYSIKSAEVHPDYRNHYKGKNDIAVIKLDRDISGVTPIKILTDFDQLKGSTSKGSEVEIVGFGHRRNILGEFGTVDTIVGSKFKTKMDVVENYSNEIVLNRRGTGACLGDSGGPAFTYINGERYLIGAASRVKGKCGSDEGQTYYSLLADTACWIKSVTDLKLGDLEKQCDTTPSLTEEALERVLGTKNYKDVALDVVELDLSNQYINDLSALKVFKNLKSLNISDNQISSLKDLRALTKLEKVNLAGNNIVELEYENYPFTVKGEELQDYNHFKTYFYNVCMAPETGTDSDLMILDEVFFTTKTEDCLQAHIRLKDTMSLSLSYLGLNDLELLRGYTGFTLLYLDGNNITDVSPLEGMNLLETLYINENLVQDFSALGKLELLNYADISDNPVVNLGKLSTPKQYLTLRTNNKSASVLSVCQTSKKLNCIN